MGTLLIAATTHRTMRACAAPTPALDDGTQQTPEDANGTPVDLSGIESDDDLPDHYNGSDPPPAAPPLEGIGECFRDAFMAGLLYGVREHGLSVESDALHRTMTNARALVNSNGALIRWARPVMLHITREIENPFQPGWFRLTCYRDKRGTLLSYGATRQVADAYARQVSGQLADR